MTSPSRTDPAPAGPGSAAAPGPRRWRDDPTLRRFLAAHVVTYAGTSLNAVAVPVLAYQLTHSAAHTSAIVALGLVPYLILGLPLAALADRADRRRIMVASELASAALAASIPLASVLDALTIGHLYAATVGIAVSFVAIDAANFGALPALAPRGQLTQVLTFQWTVDATLQLVGPAAAGALVATVGAPAVSLVDALSYLASGYLLARLRHPLRTQGPAPSGRALTAGARFVWRHPLVRSFTLLGIGNSLTIGITLGLLVPFAVEALGLADDDGRLGLLHAAGALGGLAATRLLAALAPLAERNPGAITRGALLAATLLAPALATQRSLAAAAVAYALLVAATQLTILNGIAYRQRATPDHLQGRVNVLARMIAVAGQPLGAAAGALLAGPLTVPTALALAAVGTGTSALLAATGPLRLTAASRGASPEPGRAPRRET